MINLIVLCKKLKKKKKEKVVTSKRSLPKAAAIIKKPVAKKATIPKKKKEYGVDFDIENDRCEVRISEKYNDGTSSWRMTDEAIFEFDIEGTPYCCGLKELGNFNYSPNSNIPKTEVIKAVAQMLQDVYDNNTQTKTCKTLIFTLIDNDRCNIVKEALKLKPKLFTLVKSFTNTNGNNNDFYVSNN